MRDWAFKVRLYVAQRVCGRRGHRWVVADPEWFEAGPDGEPRRTTLHRCTRCLAYDKELELDDG